MILTPINLKEKHSVSPHPGTQQKLNTKTTGCKSELLHLIVAFWLRFAKVELI